VRIKVSKPVVIVESPTKVRTLKKYIGKDFKITATAGHIKDLPPKELGIDLEKDFKAKYVQIKGKQKIIKELKAVAGDATDIYLAPDPDREGEAIAFHTAEILKKKGRKFHRVLFHELTKNGVKDALENPSDLDRSRYDAQQARRILDRLVGYQISPLLWRKVQGGLSAGRVQSVAVRIICERERSIHAFEPVEYWSVTTDLEAANPPVFNAKLVKKDGKKIEMPNKESVDKILNDLSNEKFAIESIKKKTTKRNPQPPFITSKLQQEAINRLKFSARKTMSVAQQLYEGVDLGPGEPEGLITYMRTDSLRVADEAALEAINFVKDTLGKEYTIDKPRQFKNKNKVQDAHEAIRPTSVINTPEKIASFLSPDQLSLYTLIWRRFVASQMSIALIDQNTISIKAGAYTFTVSGSTIKFKGFMSLYMNEEDTKEKDKKKQDLPELVAGMDLKSLKINPKQHFTMPPARFSEASLVKELEEKGIGRPSTYATILSTIREKGYVEFLNKYFRPSELGFIVTDLLVDNFPAVLDIAFTAKMEENLDKVETGDTTYVDLLSNFYSPFEKGLETAKEEMLSIKGVGVETELSCPQCKKEKLHIKVGKNGPFLACNGYPDCNYSRNYERNDKGIVVPIEPSFEEAEGKFCEHCGSPMMIKQGRFGEFLACSGYPDCKYTQSVHAGSVGKSTEVKCPDCEDGEIIERKSKRGKIFFGCSNYPDCSFAIWDRPVNKKCPLCDASFLTEKSTKKDGDFLKCYDKDCGYQDNL
jgi:DNA topoisomerase-1